MRRECLVESYVGAPARGRPGGHKGRPYERPALPYSQLKSLAPAGRHWAGQPRVFQ